MQVLLAMVVLTANVTQKDLEVCRPWREPLIKQIETAEIYLKVAGSYYSMNMRSLFNEPASFAQVFGFAKPNDCSDDKLR